MPAAIADPSRKLLASTDGGSVDLHSKRPRTLSAKPDFRITAKRPSASRDLEGVQPSPSPEGKKRVAPSRNQQKSERRRRPAKAPHLENQSAPCGNQRRIIVAPVKGPLT